MGIGTSDGKYYDTETDYAFDQFSKGQQSNFETKLSKEEESKYQDWKSTYAPNDSGFDYDLRGAFKAGLEPDPTTGHWPDTYKKPNHETFSDQSIYAKDAPHLAGSWSGDTYIPPAGVDIGTAAPNFSGQSPLMDMMEKTGDIQKRRFGPAASAAPLGSDMSEVAARPRDPSVDSFIDRYGVWSIEDARLKAIQDYKTDREMDSKGNIKTIPPGTRSWPGGNVISDAQPYPIESMQQYAANFEGRGSDFEGPYMHQQPYNEQHRQNLLNRAPVHKGADPALWEGTAADRRQSIQDRLDKTQDQHDQDFERFKSDWEELVKEGKAKPLSKEDSAPEAHILRVRKDNPAIREYLKDIPEDVEAFDMNDGTVVLKKKAALTSMNDATPDEIKAGQQYAMMDEDARKSGKVIRPDWGAGGARGSTGSSVTSKGEVVPLAKFNDARLNAENKRIENMSDADYKKMVTDLYKGDKRMVDQALRGRQMDKDIKSGRLNSDGSIPTSKYEDAQINQSFGKFGEKYGIPETPKGPQYFTQEGVQYMQQHYSKHFAAKENQKINEMLKEQLGEKAYEALKRGNPIDITPLK